MEHEIDKRNLALEMWKEAIGVQKHFNDIELRIRNLAITLIVAVIGAAAYSLNQNLTLHVWSAQIPLAVAVLLGGLVGWVALYSMDRFWYHHLLIGAVINAKNLEEILMDGLDMKGLTAEIGDASPVKVWTREVRSSHKINLFYLAGLLVLSLAILLFWTARPKTDCFDLNVQSSVVESANAEVSAIPSFASNPVI